MSSWVRRELEQRRAKRERWENALELGDPRAHGFRVSASACPNGHTKIPAHREAITRTRWSGKAEVRVALEHETDSCPVCGSAMMRACEGCDRDILVPVGERCESCGLLYPWAPERVRSMLRRRRDWKLSSPLPADQVYPPPPPGQPQEAAVDHDRLLLIDCDLTALLVDAIVSPDDSDGQMHSHLASAIKLQAGDEVEEQSVDSGPHRPGSAWFTTAGALKDLKGIVHVAVPEGDGRSEFDDAKRCVRSAYMEAKKQPLESLGVAAFGPGVRIDFDEGVNIARWVPAVASEVVRCMREDAGSGSPPLAVLLVVKGQRGRFQEMVELVRRQVG